MYLAKYRKVILTGSDTIELYNVTTETTELSKTAPAVLYIFLIVDIASPFDDEKEILKDKLEKIPFINIDNLIRKVLLSTDEYVVKVNTIEHVIERSLQSLNDVLLIAIEEQPVEGW